jgi:hypothetical protein
VSDDPGPYDPRASERQGWPFRWVDAPEQRASRERMAQLEAARRQSHERHWPRDAAVSWGALGGGVLFQLASLVALIVQFGLGFAYVLVLLSDRVNGTAEWVLAIGWAALTFYAVREWLFGRITVVLAPVVSAILLIAVAGWPP